MHGYRGNPIKYDLSGYVNAHILTVAVFITTFYALNCCSHNQFNETGRDIFRLCKVLSCKYDAMHKHVVNYFSNFRTTQI